MCRYPVTISLLVGTILVVVYLGPAPIDVPDSTFEHLRTVGDNFFYLKERYHPVASRRSNSFNHNKAECCSGYRGKNDEDKDRRKARARAKGRMCKAQEGRERKCGKETSVTLHDPYIINPSMPLSTSMVEAPTRCACGENGKQEYEIESGSASPIASKVLLSTMASHPFSQFNEEDKEIIRN